MRSPFIFNDFSNTIMEYMLAHDCDIQFYYHRTPKIHENLVDNLELDIALCHGGAFVKHTFSYFAVNNLRGDALYQILDSMYEELKEQYAKIPTKLLEEAFVINKEEFHNLLNKNV